MIAQICPTLPLVSPCSAWIWKYAATRTVGALRTDMNRIPSTHKASVRNAPASPTGILPATRMGIAGTRTRGLPFGRQTLVGVRHCTRHSAGLTRDSMTAPVYAVWEPDCNLMPRRLADSPDTTTASTERAVNVLSQWKRRSIRLMRSRPRMPSPSHPWAASHALFVPIGMPPGKPGTRSCVSRSAVESGKTQNNRPIDRDSMELATDSRTRVRIFEPGPSLQGRGEPRGHGRCHWGRERFIHSRHRLPREGRFVGSSFLRTPRIHARPATPR